MKWKYIVYWTMISVFTIPCPDNRPGCLVLHWDSDTTRHAKTFNDRDSAIDFRDSLNLTNSLRKAYYYGSPLGRHYQNIKWDSLVVPKREIYTKN